MGCHTKSFHCQNCSAAGQCLAEIKYVGITEDVFVADDLVRVDDGTAARGGSSFALPAVQASFGSILNISMVSALAGPTSKMIGQRGIRNPATDDFLYPAGVIGFAQRAVSSYQGPSVFEQYVRSAGLASVFSFCLNSWSLNGAVGGGVTLGAAGTKYSRAPIQYIPLVRRESGFYEVNLQSVLINNATLNLNPALYNHPHSIVDTGTPTLTFNQEVYNYLVASVRSLCGVHFMRGACGVDLPLSIFNGKTCFAMEPWEIARWPTLSLIFEGGVRLEYPPSSYLVPMWYCSVPHTVGFAIEGDKSNFGTVIGATVLQSYTTTIDWAARRVGFAPTQTCPAPSNCDL